MTARGFGRFGVALAPMVATLLASCATLPPTRPATAADATAPVDPFWRNATVYFLMTDRFMNGDRGNDAAIPAVGKPDLLRGFEGGDIAGVTQRIEAGYFDALGVDAIWTTPLIENVHGAVIEGEWGYSYPFHGYWPRDWSKVDPRLGSEADLARMIDAAHRHGIRIIADVIINHAGAVTDRSDPRWPEDWVRRGPACDYKKFAGNVPCELSFTLQDIRTESETPVALPDFMVERWRAEGRYEREMAELDRFFARTGYPRAPKYYIVKWLTDWVRDYGVDGFRVDTAKHTDPEIWGVLKREAEIALAEWRARNPDRIAGDKPFYMVGEVFNFGLDGFGHARERRYDYGDRQVDFYQHGFDALINMGFPTHAALPMPEQHRIFDADLNGGNFAGRGVLNYLASHDDMNPFDPTRATARDDATRLMLSPGGAQIYYGDEIGRSLVVPGTRGDATLRSNFDWSAVERNAALLDHWRRLGRFRKAHPALGAGKHRELSRAPYTFARVLEGSRGSDRIVVAAGVTPGANSIVVDDVFAPGTRVRDAYSGEESTVRGDRVALTKSADVILLEML
ncbi:MULTISPECIES: alpha-amylase family glycosyl hydrolase [unclassified Sphingomonas]|uniref:alpha-amylase family glycosyl hydrolase n=1 Tax=unclassified Sphingomonas TaxID=196159 RepID=UPI00082BDF12|nr:MULTISPECIES: alpha-amylase family glycosyl hydrolase [unclassified Sphingomonas]